MSSGAEQLAAARRVADAVLYEGYVLFPYRASALKNRYRWQWGVAIPRAQADLGASEPSEMSCQVALRAPEGTRVSVCARFLHLRLRQMQDVDGTPVDELDVAGVAQPTWEEGLEHEVSVVVTLGTETVTRSPPEPTRLHAVEPFTLDAEETVQDLRPAGRAVRTTWPVAGVLLVDVTRTGDDVWTLQVVVRNETSWSQRRAAREDVLRRSIVGTHVLLHTDDGAFASVIDPPSWADADLRQRGLHPVLIGEPDQVVLGAPIILYDHPQIAPESPGPSFDATEVDELLALAVMGLTDDEKRRARATDPRAADLIDRTDTLPDDVHRRLHGTIREWGPAALEPEPAADVPDEVRDLLGVAEEPLGAVRIDDREVAVGDLVRLRPTRRADAHDVFVAGRLAVVERIVRTVEGHTYLAVTVTDDPAADLHRWYGRFQYFADDEVEPAGDEQAATAARVPDDQAGAEGPTSEGGS